MNTYNASENKKQQQKYNNVYKRNLVKMDLIGDDCMMREILKRLMCSSVFLENERALARREWMLMNISPL